MGKYRLCAALLARAYGRDIAVDAFVPIPDDAIDATPPRFKCHRRRRHYDDYAAKYDKPPMEYRVLRFAR